MMSNITMAQWNQLNLPSGIKMKRSIYFMNDTLGYAVGGSQNGTGFLLETIDSGNTWVEKTLPSNGTVLNKIDFVGNTGYICGRFGEWLKSDDGGQSWIHDTVDGISVA